MANRLYSYSTNESSSSLSPATDRSDDRQHNAPTGPRTIRIQGESSSEASDDRVPIAGLPPSVAALLVARPDLFVGLTPTMIRRLRVSDLTWLVDHGGPTVASPSSPKLKTRLRAEDGWRTDVRAYRLAEIPARTNDGFYDDEVVARRRRASRKARRRRAAELAVERERMSLSPSRAGGRQRQQRRDRDGSDSPPPPPVPVVLRAHGASQRPPSSRRPAITNSFGADHEPVIPTPGHTRTRVAGHDKPPLRRGGPRATNVSAGKRRGRRRPSSRASRRSLSRASMRSRGSSRQSRRSGSPALESTDLYNSTYRDGLASAPMMRRSFVDTAEVA